MSKVKEANAVYTGGNIWLFYGTTDDGNYFLTDDNGWTQILDTDPSDDFDESLYCEWQDEHCIDELHDEERIDFCNQILDYVFANPDHDGGMTEQEIDVYREWFRGSY